MLLSMTGYGRVSKSYSDKIITVEVRSLNSKYTDVRLKIPQNYREKEAELRKLITDRVERGKIDTNIEVKALQGDEEFSLNLSLFTKYYQELTTLAGNLQMPHGDLMQAILKLPNVVVSEEGTIDEDEWNKLLSALNGAIDNFETFRKAEGEAMEKDLRLRIKNIVQHLEKVDPVEKERITRLKQRLHQNLEEHLGKDKIDENRFEQEVIFYLEKIDITEEKVRLSQHCKFFIEELDKNITIKGRKLSFISQEMGREINTLGAKAYSSAIQRLVVAMKDELEKIKEQVANSV